MAKVYFRLYLSLSLLLSFTGLSSTLCFAGYPCAPDESIILDKVGFELSHTYQDLIRRHEWQEAIWLAESKKDLSSAHFMKQKLCELMMKDHEIVSIEFLPDSSNAARKFQFKDSFSVCFKTDRHDDPDSGKEVAAYRLSELLKFHVVPMTTRAEYTVRGKKEVGSSQYFVEGTLSGKEAGKDKSLHKLVTFQQMDILDRILGNGDRQPKNWLYLQNSNRIVAIDNGNLFLVPIHIITDEEIKKYFLGAPDLKEHFLKVTSDQIRSELGPYIDRDGLRTVISRVNKIKKLLER